jgi:hypothetical protein
MKFFVSRVTANAAKLPSTRRNAREKFAAAYFDTAALAWQQSQSQPEALFRRVQP